MKAKKVLLVMLLIILGGIVMPAKTVALKTDNLEECFVITSFLSNNKNEIFLLSWQNHKVFKFKENGEFEKSFGRYGVGPGDIKRVLFMHYNPANDSLYLPEISSGIGRISIFDSNGNFKEYLDVELSPGQKDHILEFIFLADSSYYAVISERIGWEPEGKIFLTQEKYSLLYFSKENKLKNTVYTTIENDEVADKPRWGGPRILFKPSILAKKTPEENICIAKTDENIFRIYSKSGTNVGTVELEMKKVPLNGDEFEKAKAKLVEALKSDSRMQWLAKHMIQLKYKPMFDNFYVLPNYYLVLELKREGVLDIPTETTLKFFDKTGKLIKTRTITGYVMDIENNHLYIKQYDEDENESFRIEDLTI